MALQSTILMPLLLLAFLQESSNVGQHHDTDEKDEEDSEEATIPNDGANEGVVIVDDSDNGVFSSRGQNFRMASTPSAPEWDPDGYFTFCPCMGQFGNQMELYLGSLAYGKATNRTIILPPFFFHGKAVPFAHLFQVEQLRAFYPRVITMETFMTQLAPTHWPETKRIGYCCLLQHDISCQMVSKGHPLSKYLWSVYNISFVDEWRHDCFETVDQNRGKFAFKAHSPKDLSPVDHPVIFLAEAPALFPIDTGNRDIQRFFKWNSTLADRAYQQMHRLFNGEKFVGIHLRTGNDWEIACEKYEGKDLHRFSSNCRDIEERTVTKDLCYPTKERVLEETKAASVKYNLKHVFIATDRNSYLDNLKEMLGDEVKVHHLNPELPQIDLIILGQSDLFIGNCVSSFSSFVSRERDGTGKPSSFWSLRN